MVELNQEQLMVIDGGCIGCQIGETLITVGAAILAPAPKIITIPIAVWNIGNIWNWW